MGASAEISAIVLYDGDCPMCNRFVKFLLSVDKQKQLSFSPLSSTTSRSILAKFPETERLDSVVFYESTDSISIKSKAVTAILKKLKGWRWLAAIIGVFPISMSDFFYDIIARNRRKIGGPNVCEILDEDQQLRFIMD